MSAIQLRNRKKFHHLCLFFTDVANYFIRILQEDDSLSSGIAAIKTLLWVLQETECKYASVMICSLFNFIFLSTLCS